MPTIPVWFQARDYFGNKLATMSYADADNGAQQLMDAFNAAGYTIVGLNSAQLNESAEQLYRHFVDYGNAENVSPNNYFNVDYYIQQKIDQLATTTQRPPYPFTTWTKDALDAALEDAGIASYWDHYAKYGTQEGINPSAQFDTNAYLEAKAAQLNALPADQKQLLPDGTEGTWTGELVAEALANADLSALEHYYDYGIAEKVDYQPLPEPQPDVYYKAVDLAGLDNPVVGTADNENFIGTVGGANATITPTTKIDGGDGMNMLTANMSGDFRGFSNADALANIETISLVNTTKAPKMFNAQNITGVQTWNLDSTNAPINVSMLQETGTTVNIKGLSTAQTTSLQFAPGVADGVEADSMTIGLENVGKAPVRAGATPTYSGVNMRNVEDVTINSTGKENYANLAGITDAINLTVTGDSDLYVNQTGSAIRTLDATTATGDLDINLSTPTVINSAELGSGDDTLSVANLATTAKVSGGDGDDSLEITNATQNGRYQLGMSGLETLRVDGRTNIGDVRFSSEDTYGLENLVLAGWDSGNFNQIRIDNFNDYALNVQTRGNFNQTASAIMNDVADVTLTVGSVGNTSETFEGRLVAGDASNVTLNLNGTTTRPDNFNGYLDAPNATSLTINGGADNQSVSFAQTRADMVGDLSNISEIDINGSADVDLTGVEGIGQNANSLNVNASDANGNFTANFSTAPTNTNASIMVAGAQTGNNTIGISGNYSYVSVTGNVGNDTLQIAFDKLAPNATLNVDLGSGGNDRILYTQTQGQDVTGWLAALSEQNPDVVATRIGTVGADNVLTFTGNSGIVGTDQIASVAANNGVYDASAIQFAGTNNGLMFNTNNTNNTVILGDTGTQGATINMSGATTQPLNLSLTSSSTNANVDANLVTNAQVIVDQTTQGSSLTVDLASAVLTDKIQLSQANAAAGQSGVWTMTYVKDFQVNMDQIYCGEGSRWMNVISGTADDLAKWMDLSGVKGYSNINVMEGNRGFTWTDANNQTWSSYFALNVDPTTNAIAGTVGQLVSLAGVVDIPAAQIGCGSGLAGLVNGVI